MKKGGVLVKALYQPVRAAARVAFVVLAWVLVAMVLSQVFLAGQAVLVRPGIWGPHVNLGHMISMPIMILFLLSLIGWMPRFIGLSIGLYVLYTLQYVFLHMPSLTPLLPALHPVNALIIFLTAVYVARSSWRFATEGWQAGASVSRIALVVASLAAAVGAAALAVL